MKNKIPMWRQWHIHHIPSIVSAAAASIVFVALFGFGVTPTTLRPNPMRSLANNELLSAFPNPITVCDGSGQGPTLISWNAQDRSNILIRKGGQNGPIVASGSGTGAQTITAASGDAYSLYAVANSWRSINGQWRRAEIETLLSQLTITSTQNGCRGASPVTPGLQGAFMYGPTLASSNVPSFLDELKSLQMDTVVVAHVRTKTGNCSTPTFTWGPEMPDKLGSILDGAQNRGMQVYVGLDFSMDACQKYYYGDNATQVINDTAATLSTVMQRYGGHAALAGWYIPDEPDFVYMDMNSGIQYYASLVSKIREKSQKPILIAPFFAGQSNTTPAELATRALDFKNRTGVTIEVWQDSIGADPNLKLTSPGYTIKDYYSALIASLGQQSVWSDIELFNCCTTINFSGGAYRPGSITRISQQIDYANATGKKLAWLPQYHMGSVDPNRYPGAERLLSAYKAWYGLQSGYEYLRPKSYAWTTQPSPNYTDSGDELTNGKTAPTKDFFNPEWVGVQGTAELVVDLGSSKKIDWVAVHTMQNTAPAIFIPSEIAISCSSDGVSWSNPVKTARPVTAADSEYVLGNNQPLNSNCRFVKVRLQNTGWTFLSELEIVSGN